MANNVIVTSTREEKKYYFVLVNFIKIKNNMLVGDKKQLNKFSFGLSVPITTKFVSDLRLVGGFLRVLRFPPPVKLTAKI